MSFSSVSFSSMAPAACVARALKHTDGRRGRAV
jgi:hypothetical protein